MHLHTLTWAGHIYMHICAYTMSQTECPSRHKIIYAYMFRYMHIHTYTCIYCVCSYMIIYVDHDEIFVHILAYTCIYCQLQLYWILKFLHVYAYVYARICTYIETYTQVNASICNIMEIDATSNFPHTKIRAYTCNTCIYVQHTSHHKCIYVLSKSKYTCI